MKIKSIYIDGLHNAISKTYTFGDIVYIFGNNGAGKSTLLRIMAGVYRPDSGRVTLVSGFSVVRVREDGNQVIVDGETAQGIR